METLASEQAVGGSNPEKGLVDNPRIRCNMPPLGTDPSLSIGAETNHSKKGKGQMRLA